MLDVVKAISKTAPSPSETSADSWFVVARTMRSFRWAFDHVSWVPSKQQFIQALERIQPEERKKALSFVFQKDVKPSLVGRLLLRSCATQVLGVDNVAVNFTRTDKGRPKCEAIEELGFDVNVSHQGNYAVLAAEPTRKVGIDTMKIELREDVNRYFDLMKRIFSENEWQFIYDGLDSNDDVSDFARISRFMRLWSLKEAYTKAEGFGITINLTSMEFKCKSQTSMEKVVTDTEFYLNGQKEDGWSFEESLLDEKHCVAVALSRDPSEKHEPVPFSKLSFEEIVNNLTPLTDADQSDLVLLWNEYQRKHLSPQST
jgi:phosphopantetheine--protein transferase-like protein